MGGWGSSKDMNSESNGNAEKQRNPTVMYNKSKAKHQGIRCPKLVEYGAERNFSTINEPKEREPLIPKLTHSLNLQKP